MKGKKKNKNTASNAVLKLNAKPHNPFGIAAFILAILGMILAMTSIGIAAFSSMTMMMIQVVGILEWMSLMATLAGLGLALLGEGNKEKENLFVHIALIMHVIGIVYHGIVLWQGFF